MTSENRSEPEGTAGKPFFREVQIEFLVHELKGPIAVIEAGVQMLLEKRSFYGPLTARQEKTLHRNLRNAKNARQMLDDLLEIGRCEHGRFSCSRFRPIGVIYDVLFDTLEIAPGIDKIVLLETERTRENLPMFGIHVNETPATADLELWQDETKFRQIFGNLVKNALYHRRTRVDIEVDLTAEFLCIDVADDGPGIKPEHHDLIFHRYAQVNACDFSPKRQGHGLGLAGAHILSRCMGGNIELSSEFGKGARFRLILPISLGVEGEVGNGRRL